MSYKKNTKRYLALLLVLVFMFSLLPDTALAAGYGDPVESTSIKDLSTDAIDALSSDPSNFEYELAAREAEKAAAEAEAEQEYLDMLRETGMEVDSSVTMSTFRAPVKRVEEGEFLGYVTITLERFTLGSGYVLEPVSYPLYAGDTVADIVHYISGYKDPWYPHSTSTKKFSTNTGSLDRDFVLTGLWDDNAPDNNIPVEITNALTELGVQISGRQDEDWLKNGDFYSAGKWTLLLNNQFKGEADLTDYSSASDQQTLQPGDVVRLQYSITGDGRDLGVGDAKLYSSANKDRLTARVAGLNSYGRDLLTDSAYRSAYDHALEVLADVKATQEQVNNALTALMDEPDVDLDGVPINSEKDLLMGNIEGRIRVGEEYELVTLDIPRAKDDSRNFVRGDINLEVVQGKNIISIRRAPGETSGADGNYNMKLGYTYPENKSMV